MIQVNSIYLGVCHSKNGYRLRSVDKPISYATARENVITALMDIGLNSKDYGLHSPRVGGATAAENLGINDRLFNKHGRWKRLKTGMFTKI